jgi:hypothetical protein
MWQLWSSGAILKEEMRWLIIVNIFKQFFHHCVSPAVKQSQLSSELNSVPIQVNAVNMKTWMWRVKNNCQCCKSISGGYFIWLQMHQTFKGRAIKKKTNQPLPIRHTGMSWLFMLYISMGWDYVSEIQPSTSLLFIPQMIYEYECRRNGTHRENRRTRRKLRTSATSPVQHKSHMDLPVGEPGPLQWEANDFTGHGTALNDTVNNISAIWRPMLC